MNLSIVLSLESGGKLAVDGEGLSLGAIREIFSILSTCGLDGAITHKPCIADAGIPWEYRYGTVRPTPPPEHAVDEWLGRIDADDEPVSGSEHREEASETGSDEPEPPSKTVQCPDCDRMITRGYLAYHRRRKHPNAPLVPQSTPAPKPVIVHKPGDPPVAPTAAAVAKPAPSPHGETCECIRCAARRAREMAAAREARAQADEAARIQWGVNGENPPKVEHWSRHEDEQ